MPSVLVDSNVLLDVITEDEVWSALSTQALEANADRALLVVNPIVFAEVSISFLRFEDVESALPKALFAREDIPYEAAFLAGKCFKRYRERGGVKRSPLPDFFIGSHAAVAGHALLTRDAARYRTYFPKLAIIAPGAV